MADGKRVGEERLAGDLARQVVRGWMETHHVAPAVEQLLAASERAYRAQVAGGPPPLTPEDMDWSLRRELLKRGIPVRFVDVLRAAEKPRHTDALERAAEFLSDAGERTLVLSGPKGVGKSFAAAWVVAQACPDANPRRRNGVWSPDEAPRWLSVSKLARIERYNTAVMEPFEQCSMLVIDDLGVEYLDAHGSFLTTLDGLIDARYAGGLRTVITTNLTADAFKARYGERIADRIRETGEFVELAGKSLRRKEG